MRTLIIKTIACCAALLPFAQAHAAGPAGKNFYDLKPGKKFSLKVDAKSSTVAGLTGSGETAVPAGIPNFKKGQTVKFTIGSKGELKGPGISIPFKSAVAGQTVYVDSKSKSKLPNNAVVKTFNKKPTYTQLAFYKITGSGLSTKTYQVVYVLQ